MFENPRRGRQSRNLTTNVPKFLDLKSSSETDIFRKLTLGAPDFSSVSRPLVSCMILLEVLRNTASSN